jgi:hypothetical protein
MNDENKKKYERLTAKNLRIEDVLIFPDGFGSIRIVNTDINVSASWPAPDCPFMWQT